LGVNFFLAFGANAFGFAYISHPPSTASTIKAKGSKIIVIVTKRSYLRMFWIVEPDVIKRTEE
jgi:hypothetical protein